MALCSLPSRFEIVAFTLFDGVSNPNENRSEKHRHGRYQPRISEPDPNRPQNKDVSRRHQRRGSENNQKSPIHASPHYAPGRYCARLVSVSHKTTSVTFAPGGMPFNCLVISS